MSSFPGYFPGLPGVRCDRFTDARLEEAGAVVGQETGERFFLSHCHEDHMLGLSHLGPFLDLHWPEAESTLQTKRRLHCTHTSATFVVDLFKDRGLDWNHFSVIYENSPEIIRIEKVAEPYSLRVTAMDANHIPGSVMFLFEKLGVDGQVELRILYTGDFRSVFSTLIGRGMSMLGSHWSRAS